MRIIIKGNEPPSLTAHRKTPYSDYDNYSDKEALRSALSTEQRGLCCYCMGRIRSKPIRSKPAKMKIEHWQCQAQFPEKQLNYRNLLGACLGGEGQPKKRQHCDTRKANQDLRWNPAEPNHHVATRLSYERDGTISSDDPEFNCQLNEVLNLNLPLIKNNRKGVINGIVDGLKKTDPRIRYKQLQGMKEELALQAGDLSPYAQVRVWWLDELLAKASQ